MQQYQLLARWIKGQIPGKILPWQIDIDTTNICNQSCYYCNSEKFRSENPNFQPLEKYLNLIKQLAKWREIDPLVFGTISNVIFSGGGEPTLLPGYEQIIELAIDNGFVCAINSNGTKLEKLLQLPSEKIKRMAYIGLDIDSGFEDTYEVIRRSKMSSPFNKVKEVASKFGEFNAPLDIKALLLPENTTPKELEGLFIFAKDVNARGLHLRPAVIENKTFQITQSIFHEIKSYSEKYKINANIASGRYEPRQYSKCHQFFLFPSFCADGNIYLCCEYKGNPEFKLTSWLDDNWRDVWGSDTHKEIYNKFTTDVCKMCRPNTTNNLIEESLQDPYSILKGFI